MSKPHRAVAFVVVALSAVVQLAAQKVYITAPREAVIAELGPTLGYLMDGYTFQSPPAVATGEVWEIHRFKTAANEYEYHVAYYADASSSQLHPVLRVHGIEVLLDRKMRVADALNDMGAFNVACDQGCAIKREKPGRAICFYPTHQIPGAYIEISAFVADDMGNETSNAVSDLTSGVNKFTMTVGPKDYIGGLMMKDLHATWAPSK